MANQIFPQNANVMPIVKILGVDANDKTLNTKLDEHSGKLDTIQTTTGNIDTKVDNITTDVAGVRTVVDANKQLLEDPNSGLAALKNEIDANEIKIDDVKSSVDSNSNKLDTITTNTQNIEADTQDIQSTLVTVEAKIDALQKDRSFYMHIDDQMTRPDSGSEDYLIAVNHLDSSGAPDNFDADPTIVVTDNAGNDVSSTFLYNDAGTQTSTMDNVGIGEYSLRFRVVDTSNVGLYKIEVTAVEGGVTKKIFQGVHIVEAISSTFTQTDRDTLNGVGTDTDTIIVNQTTMDGKLDSIITDLSDIEGAGFDSSTDSLSAIRDAIDNQTSNNVVGKAYKQSGALSQGDSEIVILSTNEGFTSKKAALNLLKVIPTTNTSSDYDVEIFEKTGADADYLLVKYTGISAASTWWKPGEGLNINLEGLIFINQDDTPSNTIYIKITNNNDSSSSFFDVEVRFEEKA